MDERISSLEGREQELLQHLRTAGERRPRSSFMRDIYLNLDDIA